MKVKPIGNRVLIKPNEAEEKTKGGIYIPDTAKEKTQYGTVEAVGNSDLPVKVGDKVMYESYGGSEIKVEGVKYLVMEIKDILAVIE